VLVYRYGYTSKGPYRASTGVNFSGKLRVVNQCRLCYLQRHSVLSLFSCDRAVDLGTMNALVCERRFIAGGNHEVIVGPPRMT
jgi:hypothetical protein